MEEKILIAGPCSAESRDQVYNTAKQLKSLKPDYFRAGIWKPRTQPGDFEGAGLIGLSWLKEVREELGLPVITEVAKPAHVDACMEFGIDAVWIGARSTTSPFVVQELAEALRGTNVPVMVKNPVNPELSLWLGAINRLTRCGITDITAIHRGFSAYEQTDYRNRPRWQITVDLKRSIPEIPVVCDPSHIAGKSEFILKVSQKAFDMNYDGLMVETHIDPSNAWTDAKQQVSPAELEELLTRIVVRRENPSDPSDELARLRSEINDLDEELLKVLARRMRVSDKIGRYKKDKNMTILQAKRWKELLSDHKKTAIKYEISEQFISSVFKLIHQESIDIQEAVLTSGD